MNHPIFDKLETFRRQITQLVWLRSICLAVCLVFGALLLLGFLDWTLRLEALRWLEFILLVAVLLIALTCWIVPAFRYRPSFLNIARRIESQVPPLQDRLSTSVELLGRAQRDNAIESSVIHRVTDEFGKVQLDRLVITQPIRKMIFGALTLLTISVVLLAINPALVSLAVLRSVAPWTPAAWPRHNAIRFEYVPAAVAKGESINVVAFDDNQKLSEAITLVIETPSNQRVRSFSMRPMAGRSGKYRLRLENIQRNFRIRAVGGDDQTPWHNVEVIDAPKIRELIAHVYPPSNTQLPNVQAQGSIETWPGAQIEIEGLCDKPILSATVYYDRGSGVEQYSADVDANSKRFKLRKSNDGFVADKPGWYWITVTDRDSEYLQTPHKWKVDLVNDQPPRIEVESAGRNRIDLRPVMGVRSIFRFQIRVNDELELRKAAIHLTGSANAVRELALSEVRSANTETEFSRDYSAVAEINLNDFSTLRPGDAISISVSAIDLGGKVGHSNPINLQVVSQQSLLNQIYRYQSDLLKSLQTASLAHREAVNIAAQIESELKHSPPNDSIVDMLRKLKPLESRVIKQLFEDDDSAILQLSRLIEFADVHDLDWTGRQATRQVWSRFQQLNAKLIPGLTSTLSQCESLILENRSKFDDLIARTVSAISRLKTDQLSLQSAIDQSIIQLQQTNFAHRMAAAFIDLAQQQMECMENGRGLSRQMLGGQVPSDQTKRNLVKQQRQIRFKTRALIEEMESMIDAASPTIGRDQQQMIRRVQSIYRQSNLFSILQRVEVEMEGNRFGSAGDLQLRIAKLMENIARSLNPNARLDIRTAHQIGSLRQQFQAITDGATLYRQRLIDLISRYDFIANYEVEQERETLNLQKQQLLTQLDALGQRIDATTFAAASKLLAQVKTTVQQLPSESDLNALKAESKLTEQVIQLLKLAQNELIADVDEPARKSNYSETLKAFNLLVSEQESILSWTKSANDSAQRLGQLDIDDAVRRQADVRKRFQKAVVVLPQKPILDWLVESTSTSLAGSQAALAQRQFGSDTQQFQTSSIDNMRQISTSISMLIKALGEDLDSESDANQDMAETQKDSQQARVDSLELYTLYVIQQQLHSKMTQWQIAAENAKSDPQSLSAQRLELNERQQKLAEMAREIAKRASTKPTNDIPEIPDF